MWLATPKAGKRAMSLFNPKDLLFETCVWDSFGRQEATWTLAIEIALLEPEANRVRVTVGGPMAYEHLLTENTWHGRAYPLESAEDA
jgi:hypothetical protein